MRSHSSGFISDFSKATASTEQISAFTSLPNSSSRDTISSASAPHNSLPKSRSTYRDIDTAASEIQTSWSSSIADRAKTRVRGSAVSSSVSAQLTFESDIISISSDSDDELSNLPKKARQKSRNKTLDDSEFDPSSGNSSHPPDSSQVMSVPPIAVLENTGAGDFEPPQSDFFASTEIQHSIQTTEKASKKSKKSKTREEKGKKSTKKRRARDPGFDDEVQAKSRTKKGKTKDTEVFKSKEFIDDEDEDEIPQTHLRQATARSLEDNEPDNSKPTETVPEDEEAAPTAAFPDVNVPGYTESPTVRAGKGAKRKAGNDDEFDDVEEEAPRKKSRTKKGGPKGTNKAKSVILSDEEDPTMVESNKENRRGPSKPAEPALEAAPKEGSGDSNNKVGQYLQRYATDINSSKNMSPATPQPAAAKPLGRSKSTPMTELIKRVNSLPSSPFPKPSYRNGVTAYSPYLKTSRSALSRIAPLHPNRRTPPPPPPPPPPPKKSKKQLEQEEKWEDELIEEAGGITEWSCMSDLERKELRRMKRERETRGWED